MDFLKKYMGKNVVLHIGVEGTTSQLAGVVCTDEDGVVNLHNARRSVKEPYAQDPRTGELMYNETFFPDQNIYSPISLGHVLFISVQNETKEEAQKILKEEEATLIHKPNLGLNALSRIKG